MVAYSAWFINLNHWIVELVWFDMENDCECIYCSITSEDAILESKHRNKLNCVGWVIFIYSITSNNVMVKF